MRTPNCSQLGFRKLSRRHPQHLGISNKGISLYAIDQIQFSHFFGLPPRVLRLAWNYAHQESYGVYSWTDTNKFIEFFRLILP